MTREQIGQALENGGFTKEREVYLFGRSKITLDELGMTCDFSVGKDWFYSVNFTYSCLYDEIREIEIEGEEGDHEILIHRLGGIENLLLND